MDQLDELVVHFHGVLLWCELWEEEVLWKEVIQS
jgi:hypothetical protein